MSRRQGIYWIGTIPKEKWIPSIPDEVSWIKGQLELGSSGYEHWQFVFSTSKKTSLAQVCSIFEGTTGHFELTRSNAADQYVWKDDTSLGEQFEFGRKPLKRNNAVDWEQIRQSALVGDLSAIPPDVFVRYYRSLTSIAQDHLRPVALERTCQVFWGKTGTGKSMRAWSEAGMDAFSKDPRTKWWTGYRDQGNVVVDEFRGDIDISHILRWIDRYPVSVETKGSARPLLATKFWFTSNLDPRSWYPDICEETRAALLRRLKIIHFDSL